MKKNKKSLIKEKMSHEEFSPIMSKFSDFASKALNLKNTPEVSFVSQDDGVLSFGGYNPSNKKIVLKTSNRHPMDIFRTIAHEFVHAKQHEDGKIGKDIQKEGETGSEYENEANAMAGVIMRNFAKKYPDTFKLKSLKEAIFVVGGPCCGKDRIIRHIVENYNMYEHDVAHIEHRSPTEDRVVVNASACSLETIRSTNEELKKLNYETSLIFVDVENNISKLRNEQRAVRGQRVISENLRLQKYKISKNNLEIFSEMFEDMLVIDNSETLFKSNKEITENLHQWFKSRSPKTGARGWVQVGGKYDGYPCARQPGQTSTPKCRSDKERSQMTKKEKKYAFRAKQRKDPNQPEKKGGAKPTMVATYKEEKDACYHKVKSRYNVFPSAYASGALVKCRKVGAANWGSKSKKKVNEDFNNFMSEQNKPNFPDKIPTAATHVNPTSLYEKVKKRIIRKKLAQEEENGSKLTNASGAVGLPVSDSIGAEFSVAKSPSIISGLTGVTPVSQGATAMYPFGTYGIAESVINWMNKAETQNRFIEKYGDEAQQKLIETAINLSESMNTDHDYNPKHFEQIRDLFEAKYPSTWSSGGPSATDSTRIGSSSAYKDGDFVEEDWSDVKHQDPRGGLKASGVRAYRRENPGSKLKTAVRTEPSKLKKGGKSWKRRKSFCARSSGQMKMWPKAAKDPNSRLRKARRAWNCE